MLKKEKALTGEVSYDTRKIGSTLRTDVTDKPLLTRVSAIHPPRFAENAIVSHGSTQKSPDSVRLNFRTCQIKSFSIHSFNIEDEFVFYSVISRHVILSKKPMESQSQFPYHMNMIISRCIL